MTTATRTRAYDASVEPKDSELLVLSIIISIGHSINAGPSLSSFLASVPHAWLKAP
jgi:hypothetical protein